MVELKKYLCTESTNEHQLPSVQIKLTNKLKPVTEAKEVAMEAPESASSPR